jgi:hypothetical protein
LTTAARQCVRQACVAIEVPVVAVLRNGEILSY